jgi:hypothetical protein
VRTSCARLGLWVRAKARPLLCAVVFTLSIALAARNFSETVGPWFTYVLLGSLAFGVALAFGWLRPRTGSWTAAACLALIFAATIFCLSFAADVCSDPLTGDAQPCDVRGATTWAATVLLLPVVVALMVLPLRWMCRGVRHVWRMFRAGMRASSSADTSKKKPAPRSHPRTGRKNGTTVGSAATRTPPRLRSHVTSGGQKKTSGPKAQKK